MVIVINLRGPSVSMLSFFILKEGGNPCRDVPLLHNYSRPAVVRMVKFYLRTNSIRRVGHFSSQSGSRML